ncbi:MAG: hypothetical protein MET45_23870 [Nostoc sp. LLA-1]|nr:hypothetical protein [Cyanocohniella sp. LLY]
MNEGLNQAVALAPIETTVWVMLGIIISLVLPLAVRTLQSAQEATRGLERNRLPWWKHIAATWTRYGGSKYLKIFLAATLVAVVLVFLLGLKFYTSRDAALAGFAWESLINKLFKGAEETQKSP